MVCKIEETEILAGSGVVPSTGICNCHGSDCGCGMNVCHNPNACTNGCGNKTKETLFEPNYFYDE